VCNRGGWGTVPPSDIISVGELEVRPHEHCVLVSGLPVALSSREFDIVMMLAEHPGWVFSADQLAGYPEESGCSPDSVSVLVYRLRQKLAEAGATDLVETVRGLGYRLHAASAARGGTSAAEDARRELRDACWQLQEAVTEVDHSGSQEQQRAVTTVLEQARRDVYTSLAE
jgi:DNA-binding winged helix-turn-helix (wHTH) protein